MAVERQLALVDKSVKYDSERPNISGLWVVAILLYDVALWRREARRALAIKEPDSFCDFSTRAGEVRELYLSGRATEKDIVRLDISMNHLKIVVEMCDGCCELPE